MRYAEYILKLENLYLFYTTYILSGLVDVLGIYLGYDNIGDILLQNVVTLVYVQVIGYMRTGRDSTREFKRIVWICSFFEFPTRSHVTYNSGYDRFPEVVFKVPAVIFDVVIHMVYSVPVLVYPTYIF